MTIKAYNQCVNSIEEKLNIALTGMEVKNETGNFSFRFILGDREYSLRHKARFNDYIITNHTDNTQQLFYSVEQVVDGLLKNRESFLALLSEMKSSKLDEILKVRKDIDGVGIGNPRLGRLCDQLSKLERELKEIRKSYDINVAAIKS